MREQFYELRFMTPEHGLYASRYGQHIPVPARGDWVCFERRPEKWVVEHVRFEYMHNDNTIVTCWIAPAPDWPAHLPARSRRDPAPP